ncbi:MAG: ATP-binding protein [Nitrososphaerota archaeon]|nr:ATP-binding protein [Candidatus Bathyarchaeota archaeon]MDW8048856.1 ATP-binding protein [Nitrososphaerota archaeon]
MRLFKKVGNTLHILSFPGEEIEKGGYLVIEDHKAKKSMVAQVIDIQYANVPGIMEELLRSPNIEEDPECNDIDPLNIVSHIQHIQDTHLLICKIHGTIFGEEIRPENSWLPSRIHSTIKRLTTESLLKIIGVCNGLRINLGWTHDMVPFFIDACELDGRLNVITGKKGTGKSHLSKIIALGLVEHGATVIVFDINGEYTNLGLTCNGEKNRFYDKIHILSPGKNFKVTLYQTDLYVILRILTYVLDLPGTSAREFRQIWRLLHERGSLTLSSLGDAIRRWECNQHVRDAMFSRYHALLNSNFFTDNMAEAVDFEGLIRKIEKGGGGVIVVDLSETSHTDRQIVVEFILAELQEALSQRRIEPIFLFAEEAHLYLRETYWDDVVTRMRHLGIFTTFVTNQPNTINENIYRQVDNIFLLNFVNEHDLETVSRAAKVDAETVISIVRDLPPHYCLVLGKIVKDFPMIIKIRPLDIKMMGETRFFWKRSAENH